MRNRIELTRHEVILQGLPTALSGTTAVHISDTHYGCPGGEALAAEAVELANGCAPDLMLVTGDFVDRRPDDIARAVDLALGLRAKVGIYAVLGNHDYYAGAEEVAARLLAGGIALLMNEAAEALPGLWIAGIDDLLRGQPDGQKALSDVPAEAALIFLTHHPNGIEMLPEERAALVLAGHTHGGQFNAPRLLGKLLCRHYLQTEYVHGWYQRGAASMHVSRGVGAAGGAVLGRRLRCRPEVSLLTLRS